MKHAFTVASLVAASLLSPPTASADGSASEGQKKNSMCIGCHGIEGYRTVYPAVYSVPKIGGQGAGYIVSALKAYKAGDRGHPSMRAIAASLSEQDMQDLAAYYSGAN
jgi:cytochrome c553